MTEAKIEVITGPNSRVIEALKGRVSEPKEVISYKHGSRGEKVKVSLVEEGAGMVGLKDREDNREWAGIFNHLVKTGRVATFLAKELQKTGVDIDPRVVLNAILVSHAGRRQWDEACWYPDIVVNAQEKKDKRDVQLTREILEKIDLPERVKNVVQAHGIPTMYPLEKIDTWEKKVALYIDYRVTHVVMDFDARVADFAKRAIQEGRVAEKDIADLIEWGHRTEKEIFSKLDTQPEDITDEFPPQPRWEQYIRRLYINDAEQGIFTRLSELHKDISEGTIGNKEKLKKEFPENTWWGKYVRELYSKRQGQPLHPRLHKQLGINRAIEFYHQLEEARVRRELN